MNMQHNTLKIMETENQKSRIQTKFESKSDDSHSNADEN